MTDRGGEASGPGKKRGWKKPLLTTLQVGLTLAALYYVFHDPAKRAEMWKVLRAADRGWLLAGFASYGVVELIAAVRWRLLLNVQGIVLSWTRLNALLLIGVFFNYFVPGGTGGDVVKIYYLLKETPGHRGPALLSVLVDRLAGVISLCLLAGVLTFARWDWLMSAPAARQYIWAGLIILGSSLGGLHFTYIVTRHGWVHKLPARMPGRDKLAEIALAYHLYAKSWRESLAALVLSLFANVGYFITFYCAGRALHSSLTLLDLCTIMPIVNTIAAMPISLGGVGVREGLFQIFLGELCGVPAPVAVLISSVGYLLTLGWGLIGGVVYLFYRPSEHARLREIQAEVRAFEHEVAEEEVAHEAAEREK
jgi:uncharacterized protein (TIRG00374 family)